MWIDGEKDDKWMGGGLERGLQMAGHMDQWVGRWRNVRWMGGDVDGWVER